MVSEHYGRRSQQAAFEWAEEKLKHYVQETGRGLRKDRERFAAAEHVLDQHRAYQQSIKTHYRQRDEVPDALEKAIEACQKQIELAPEAIQAFQTLPETRDQPLGPHLGFHQLAIIREREKNYAEAIRLSKRAHEQGWKGEWEKRIARCEAKLAR